MGAPAPPAPAPALCLLLACVSLPWGEPTGASLRVQALGEKGCGLGEARGRGEPLGKPASGQVSEREGKEV